MVAYFKVRNNVFMAIGALIGAAAGAAAIWHRFYMPDGYASLFIMALFVFAGVIIGRIFSAFYANQKLNKIKDILYRQGNAKRFLEEFTPIVEHTPHQTVEYVDGIHHLAYAWEALGEYEKALELLDTLHLDRLKLHVLLASAIIINQKLHLHLLLQHQEEAKDFLEKLKEIQKEAENRAPAVGRKLSECVRLGEIWLKVILGENIETGDIQYIQQEISLTQNPIHSRQMKVLLGEMKNHWKDDCNVSMGQPEKRFDISEAMI